MRCNYDLDSWLDAALATYSKTDMPEGLAEQVLVSARLMGNRRRSGRWMLWMVGIPTLACLALTVFAVWHHLASSPSAAHVARPQTYAAVNQARQGESSGAVGAPAAAHLRLAASGSRRIGDHAIAREKGLPKLEIFPTPIPLTAKERALAALLNQNPKDVSQSLADGEKKSKEPIRLTAIQIPPINPLDQGGN